MQVKNFYQDLRSLHNIRNQGRTQFMGELFNIAILTPVLVMVGLGLGFLLLKLQGGEE